MKKTIIWSLAIIMGLSLALIAPLSAEEREANTNTGVRDIKATTTVSNEVRTRELVGDREKILTPGQICLFKDIVRQGNSLYGVKRSEAELANSNANCPAATPALDRLKQLPEQARAQVQTAAKQMEKIAAPWLVHQYEQVRQVGNALWGLKKEGGEKKGEEASQSRPQDASMEKLRINNNEEKSCIFAAIKNKDESLKENNTKLAADLNILIEERMRCQMEAITAQEKPGEAIATCNRDFNQDHEKARKAARAAQELFWNNYKAALAACRPVNSVEAGDKIMIEDGGVSLF